MDLFEQVLHAIEGEETESRMAYSADGEKTIQVRTFGPDRWIERAEIGRLDAINFLAVILFAVRDTFNLEHERRIVEEWAKIIRAAAMAGEITPRNPVTLLPLQTLPDGWEWLVSIEDADKFVKARGMGWSCTGIVEHLATQSTHPSIALMEQNPQLFTSKHSAAPPPAAEPTANTTEAINGKQTPISWQEQARQIADELFNHDTNAKCRDGLIRRNGRNEIVGGYAYRVMEEMQKREIHGPRGRFDNPGTISREALQGDKWWARKPK